MMITVEFEVSDRAGQPLSVTVCSWEGRVFYVTMTSKAEHFIPVHFQLSAARFQ